MSLSNQDEASSRQKDTREFKVAPHSPKYITLTTSSWSQRSLCDIEFERWKQTSERQQWRNRDKKEDEGIFHVYIPVSLTVLDLFKIPTDALEGVNVSAQVAETE